MTQRQVRRLLRLKIARQATYHTPIFDKTGKRTQFTFKHKLPIIKCNDFLNRIGCDRPPVTRTIMVICDQNQRQRDNKSKVSRLLREEQKTVVTSLKIKGLAANSISLALGALSLPSACNSYDRTISKQQKIIITSKYKIIESARWEVVMQKDMLQNTTLVSYYFVRVVCVVCAILYLRSTGHCICGECCLLCL